MASKRYPNPSDIPGRYPASGSRPGRYPPEAGASGRYPDPDDIPGRYPVYGEEAPAAVPPGSPIVYFDSANINGANNVGISDTDPIGTWTNLGSLGAALNIVQALPGARPMYDANGIAELPVPSVYFDGNDRLTSPPVASQGTAIKKLFVLSTSNLGTNPYYSDNQPGAAKNFGLGTTTSQLYMVAGTPFNTTLALVAGPSYIIGNFNGASSYAVVNGSASGTGNPGTGGLTGTTIGAKINATAPMIGHIWGAVYWKIDGSEPSDAAVAAFVDAKWGATWPKT